MKQSCTKSQAFKSNRALITGEISSSDSPNNPPAWWLCIYFMQKTAGFVSTDARNNQGTLCQSPWKFWNQHFDAHRDKTLNRTALINSKVRWFTLWPVVTHSSEEKWRGKAASATRALFYSNPNCLRHKINGRSCFRGALLAKLVQSCWSYWAVGDRGSVF